jgi:glutamyl-tRNA reductase
LQQFQELAEESQEIIEKKLQLLWDYLPKRTTRQKVQKMEQEVNGNMPELEQGTETNFTQTRIEREETKANVDTCIQSQIRSKLIHNPPNDFIDEQRFRRLPRYTPVF